MRNRGITVAAILAAFLLISVPVIAAGTHNVSLTSVGSSGVTGMASTIVGSVAGSNPYQNVEINMKMNQAAPANMVYQGWLIDSKDNVKQSLGAFSGTQLSIREKMVNFDASPYDAVAVSLEPANSTSIGPTTIVAQGSFPGTTVASTDFTTVAVLPPDEAFQRQAVAARFNMTPDQYNSLRMMGWAPSDIALIGSTASRCNKSTNDVATMLQQGQSWDQIASSCNMTTAMLFTPYPSQAVAGSVQEMGTTPSGVPVVTMPVYYRTYPNGRPVITEQDWRYFRKAGYSWQDVAVAANIAAETGVDPATLLRRVTVQGDTWLMISQEYGLDYDTVKETNAWPFNQPQGTYTGTPPMEAPPATAPTTQPSTPAPSSSGY